MKETGKIRDALNIYVDEIRESLQDLDRDKTYITFDFTPMEPLQKGGAMTTVTLVISFLILILLVVAGAQNSAVMQIKFVWWSLQMSLTEVIFWAAVGGAAIVAALSLPKMGKTYMETRRLHKEIRRLEKLCRDPSEEVKET